MDVTGNIGRTIARERRAAGVTQEALAGHLGVTKAAVSKWELGLSLPDVSLLPRIAAYFSLSLDELFDWRAQLSEAEAAELFAQVCAEGRTDVAVAREHLRRAVAEHYSDWNLLLMMASLLTTWSATAEGGDEAADLRDEALVLLDRVLAGAEEPGTLALARQAKGTTLFSAGDVEGAAALLEPLARPRFDDTAAAMLLASCYRRLGREDEAEKLLQSRRLSAGLLVLTSLLQEIGTSDDAAFVRAAAEAARGVATALSIEAVNPLFSVTLEAEVADALLRVGEKDEALAGLARAVGAAERLGDAPDAAPSPLFSRVLGRLDPSLQGPAWAEHKRAQLDEAASAARAALAERLADPSWEGFADDPALASLRSRAAALR